MHHNLIFIIPVRHPQSVKNWDIVQKNLNSTLASISNQTTKNWECRIVANTNATLPKLPQQCIPYFVDLPCPNLPDPTIDKEKYYEAVRLDKGLRIHAAMAGISPETHVMVVDFDDFVNSNIAEYVNHHKDEAGWYIGDGYVYSGGLICYAKTNLHKMCGSTHIIKRKLFGTLENEDGSPNLTMIKRYLGSHIFIKNDLDRQGVELKKLPFKGIIYRIGNPQSTSKTSGLIKEMSSLKILKQYPIAFLKTLFNYRLITRKIKQSFSL